MVCGKKKWIFVLRSTVLQQIIEQKIEWEWGKYVGYMIKNRADG